MARAGYIDPTAGPGFRISLRIPDNLSGAQALAGASIGLRTDSLPAVGEHTVVPVGNSRSLPHGAFTALIGMSGSDTYWESESGRVNITRATEEGSLAGDFSMTLRCFQCMSLDPAVRLRIAGTFTTDARGR